MNPEESGKGGPTGDAAGDGAVPGGEGAGAGGGTRRGGGGREERRRWALASLLIAAGVGLFHWRSLSFTFTSDDWWIVGPPAAKRFLSDPSSLLGALIGNHYQPLGGLLLTAESLLFGSRHLGYHLVTLALLSGLGLLLAVFLRASGAGFPAALAASLCFTLSSTNSHVVIMVFNQLYLLLGILLVAALLFWRAYLAEGRRRDLALTALFVGGAQYVHSTAVLYPIVLLAFPLFYGRRKVKAFLLLAGLVFVLQALPRLLLASSSRAGPSLHADLPGFLEGLALTAGRVLSWNSWHLGATAAWAMAGLLGVIVIAWARRPRLLSLVLPGLAVVAATLAPPFSLGWDPGYFSTRLRYLFLPTLGLAVVLAALLDSPRSLRSSPGKWVVRGAAAGLTAIYFACNWWGTMIDYRHFGEQSRYINTVIADYLATAGEISRRVPCERITLYDVPLQQTRPASLTTNLLIQGLDHRTIHEFYFAFDAEMMRRFTFRSVHQGTRDPGDPCQFTLLNGKSLKGLPSVPPGQPPPGRSR